MLVLASELQFAAAAMGVAVVVAAPPSSTITMDLQLSAGISSHTPAIRVEQGAPPVEPVELEAQPSESAGRRSSRSRPALGVLPFGVTLIGVPPLGTQETEDSA
jgi:hypothetical protein